MLSAATNRGLRRGVCSSLVGAAKSTENRGPSMQATETLTTPTFFLDCRMTAGMMGME